MNQKIIHGLNKHFCRRDIFGLVSYPVSFDGRTADASIIREQFGKEGGDGSDGLLHVILLKARSMFGDEDTFTGSLDKGLAENNFWDILELRVIEVLFQEYYLNDAVKDQVPGVVWGLEIILKKWYHISIPTTPYHRLGETVRTLLRNSWTKDIFLSIANTWSIHPLKRKKI